MAKTLGYFVTWTTYGTWLQGEVKGYVKDGHILGTNPRLRKANINSLTRKPVKLNKKQKEIVQIAILQESQKHKYNILAIAVCSNHVHIVLEYCGKAIEKIIGQYKTACRVALRRDGIKGRVWTRGYDKRYCYDKEELEKRINYVRAHNKV